MRKIELEIVADNSQYIQSTRQVTDATGQMQKKVEERQKREKGLIEDTIDAIKAMEEARKKAYDIKEVEKYNKKIAEARLTLDEYNKVGIKTTEVIKEQGKEMSGYGDKTKEVGNAIGAVSGAAGGAVSKVRSLGAAFKALIANPIGIAITAIVAAFTALIKLLKSTDSGITEIHARMEQLKAIFDVIRQRIIAFGSAIGNIFKGNWKQAAEDMKASFQGIGAQMREATAAAYAYQQALDVIQNAEDNYISQSADIRNEIAKLEYSAQDRTKTFTERKKALEDAIRLGEEELEAQKEFSRRKLEEEIKYLAGRNRLTETEVYQFLKMTEEERAAADETLKTFYNLNENRIINLEKMYAEWVDLDTRFFQVNKRNISRLSGFIEQETRAANEKRLAQQKEFTEALIKIEEAYDDARIKGLEGRERITAERDLQLEQINALRTHLNAIGTLTEEHLKWLAALEESARTEALKKELDYEQAQIDATIEHGHTIRDLERLLQEEALELLEDNQKARLRLQIKFAEEDIRILEATGGLTSQAEIAILRQRIEIWNREIEKSKETVKSVWTLFGLDASTDEGKEAIAAAEHASQVMVNSVVSTLDEVFAARVADAERTRNLLDSQISMTQNALKMEMDLMKAGYASNVDAKREELEQLKKEREKALKDEEEAIKKQRQLDSVMQLSSLISASADIFKTTAKIPPPLGQILAVAAIGAMMTAFAATKVRAASATKLEKGGVGTAVGIIEGRRHSQGGERFLEHLEVEKGEMWGVLNRRATRKHGSAFAEIVNNFNRDTVIERPDVLLNVDETNARLNKVEYQLIKLNEYFSSQSQVKEYADRTVVKKGNKTRIIRK